MVYHVSFEQVLSFFFFNDSVFPLSAVIASVPPVRLSVTRGMHI